MKTGQLRTPWQPRVDAAEAHLEDAETAIMSFVASASSADPDSDDFPDAVPMLLAVMRSVSRAAAILGTIADDPQNISAPRYSHQEDLPPPDSV